MSIDVLNACADGYTDRMLDLQILGVHTGFWSGYYAMAKKPKPLKTVIDILLKDRNRKSTQLKQDKPAVDVDAFLEQERIFNEKLLNQIQ